MKERRSVARDHELRSIVRAVIAEGHEAKADHLSSAISARQAWKAFRMGVVASGVLIQKDQREQQRFWKVMRERFREWFASYAVGRLKKLDDEGSVDLREPFNPPRTATPRQRGMGRP